MASAISIGLIASCESALAQNVLVNGDFSEGAGDLPSAWNTQSWIDLQSTKYEWIRPSADEPGVVAIDNRGWNDARWIQSLRLEPGWYYVGAQAKAGCEGRQGRLRSGALVSLTDLGVVSNDLRGTGDWENLSFYLKIGAHGAEVQIALRLHCLPSYDQAGHAMFRGASVVRVDGPPGAGSAIDLDEARAHFGGNPWSLLLIAIPLLAGIAAGWTNFKPPVA